MEEATEQVDAGHRASTIPVEDGELNRPTARHVSRHTGRLQLLAITS
jgi:hypothetical protein